MMIGCYELARIDFLDGEFSVGGFDLRGNLSDSGAFSVEIYVSSSQGFFGKFEKVRCDASRFALGGFSWKCDRLVR